jgi:hypothetical protein
MARETMMWVIGSMVWVFALIALGSAMLYFLGI